MQVYTTRKFLTLLAVSVIIAVTVAYGIVAIVPSIIPLHSPSFSLSTSPSPLQVTPGSSGTYTVHLNSQNGFSGLLKLEARIPNAPNSLTVAVSPREVSLSPGSSAAVTLSVTTNPVTPAGIYSILLDETSQLLSRTDTVNLSVVGFTVSANPTSLSFSTTSTGRSDITVTSVDNFTGQVNLSASSSASGTFVNVNPNSLFLVSNGTAISTLTVQSSAQGRFDVTVTVIGNQFYQSVTLPATATSTSNSGDFSIATIPASFRINPGSFRNIIVKLDGMNGCGCLVTLAPSIPTPNFAYGISPYIVAIPAGGSANSTLTLSLDSNAVPGTYTVTVTGTSLSIIRSAQLTVTVTDLGLPNFTLPPNPNLRVNQGDYNVSTIFVTPINGFTGPVTLTATIYPLGSPGLSISFNPTTVQLPGSSFADGRATSTLTLSAATSALTAGYNFTITGTSGTLSNSVYGNFFVRPPPHSLFATSVSQAPLPPASSLDSAVNSPARDTPLVSNPVMAMNALDLIASTALTLLPIPTASTTSRTSIHFRKQTHSS